MPLPLCPALPGPRGHRSEVVPAVRAVPPADRVFWRPPQLHAHAGGAPLHCAVLCCAVMRWPAGPARLPTVRGTAFNLAAARWPVRAQSARPQMHNARRRRRQASAKLSKAAAAALGSGLPCKGGKAACMEDDSAAALPQSPFSSCALEELKQPPLKQPKAARSGSGGLHSTACSGGGGGGGGGTSGGGTGAAGSSADACPRGLVPVDLAHLASATSRYPSTGSNESELLALHGSTGLSHSAGGTPWDRLAEPGAAVARCAGECAPSAGTVCL